ARADEADAGKDAERKALEVEHGEGRHRLAGGGEQHVGLELREAGGETDEHRRAHARRMATLIAIEAGEQARDGGEQHAERDLLPGERQRHGSGYPLIWMRL